MLEEKKTLYSLRDITIIPSVESEITSRSECYPKKLDILGRSEKLPIIAAPMSSLINNNNYKWFEDSGFNAIIPRNIDIKTRL